MKLVVVMNQKQRRNKNSNNNMAKKKQEVREKRRVKKMKGGEVALWCIDCHYCTTQVLHWLKFCSRLVRILQLWEPLTMAVIENMA